MRTRQNHAVSDEHIRPKLRLHYSKQYAHYSYHALPFNLHDTPELFLVVRQTRRLIRTVKYLSNKTVKKLRKGFAVQPQYTRVTNTRRQTGVTSTTARMCSMY